MLMARAAKFRESAGRLTGQWEDPIERALAERTGLSSAAGGPQHNGVPGRVLHLLDPQETAAYEAFADAVEVMASSGGTRRSTRWRPSWRCLRSGSGSCCGRRGPGAR